MTLAVVDTNVLVVANGMSDGVGPTCQLAAVRALVSIRDANAVVIDAGGEILAEYAKYCSYAGQPGVGDEFFRWVVENQGLVCGIVLSPDDDRRYVEFPNDPGLAGFDWDDRVFVAVSASSATDARVVNAVDSDYSHHRNSLAAAGVQVEELCPDELKPL